MMRWRPLKIEIVGVCSFNCSSRFFSRLLMLFILAICSNDGSFVTSIERAIVRWLVRPFGHSFDHSLVISFAGNQAVQRLLDQVAEQHSCPGCLLPRKGDF